MFKYYILFTDCGERNICCVLVNGHCSKKVAIDITLTLFIALLIACERVAGENSYNKKKDLVLVKLPCAWSKQ